MKNIVLFVALESEFNNFEHPNVAVHYTGVGKVNAAIKATEIITKINQKSIILNYGSAGSSDLPKDSFIKCTKFAQGDMDATPLEKKGKTPFDNLIYPDIPEIISFSNDGATCYTYDKFQQTPNESVVDMESYAIAKVCKIFGFNFSSYKYISDDGDANDWNNFHSKGQKKFLEYFKNFLDNI